MVVNVPTRSTPFAAGARAIHALDPPAKRTEQAAALLHDVGKTVSGLGWLMRIVATIVGPRGSAFAMYHDHENLAVQMLQGISDQRTLDLIGGAIDDVVMVALRQADEI